MNAQEDDKAMTTYEAETPAGPEPQIVAGYPIRLDLAYDPMSRTWLEPRPEGSYRVGMDPVEVEASGTIAALVFVEVGTCLKRGEPLGSVEAEKFVGPLTSPLTATVSAVNPDVVARPSLVDADPYGAWLVELSPLPGCEEADLLRGAAEVRRWFEAQVAEYRLKGVLAE